MSYYMLQNKNDSYLYKLYRAIHTFFASWSEFTKQAALTSDSRSTALWNLGGESYDFFSMDRKGSLRGLGFKKSDPDLPLHRSNYFRKSGFDSQIRIAI